MYDSAYIYGAPKKKNCSEGWTRNNINTLTVWMETGALPAFDTQ